VEDVAFWTENDPVVKSQVGKRWLIRLFARRSEESSNPKIHDFNGEAGSAAAGYLIALCRSNAEKLSEREVCMENSLRSRFFLAEAPLERLGS
jgi:hypothetical protein